MFHILFLYQTPQLCFCWKITGMESMLRGALIVNVYVLQPPPSSIHPSNEYHVVVLPYIQLINGTV